MRARGLGPGWGLDGADGGAGVVAKAYRAIVDPVCHGCALQTYETARSLAEHLGKSVCVSMDRPVSGGGGEGKGKWALCPTGRETLKGFYHE